MRISDEDLKTIHEGLLDNPKLPVGGYAVLSIIERLQDAERNLQDSHSKADSHARTMDAMVAWEAGELSEGQVVVLTGLDRIRARECKDTCIKMAQKYWQKWRAANPPQAPESAVR